MSDFKNTVTMETADIGVEMLTLKLAGGGGFVEYSLGFFILKFLPLDQLPNAFAQLFLDNEDIF